MIRCDDVLQELREAMRSGHLLSSRAFVRGVDAILRKRESPAFDEELGRLFVAVSALLGAASRADLEYIEDFVEEVFVHVFEQTRSDDLSAYVSDDFGLVAQALHAGYEDETLNGLVDIYGQCRIPCDTIAPAVGTLRDHVRRVANPSDEQKNDGWILRRTGKAGRRTRR
jgi:hypothetical protein